MEIISRRIVIIFLLNLLPLFAEDNGIVREFMVKLETCTKMVEELNTAIAEYNVLNQTVEEHTAGLGRANRDIQSMNKSKCARETKTFLDAVLFLLSH